MDLLTLNNYGFSLIETLVTIVIIGLIITFASLFFERTFQRTQPYTKSEALYFAINDINSVIFNKTLNDTTYGISSSKIYLTRKISDNDNTYTITISITDRSGKELFTLSRILSK